MAEHLVANQIAGVRFSLPAMPFRPEFFDIFGLATFSFVTIISIWSLKTAKPLPKWAVILFLIIGIAGLIVDGGIVYTTYVK